MVFQIIIGAIALIFILGVAVSTFIAYEEKQAATTNSKVMKDFDLAILRLQEKINRLGSGELLSDSDLKAPWDHEKKLVGSKTEMFTSNMDTKWGMIIDYYMKKSTKTN